MKKEKFEIMQELCEKAKQNNQKFTCSLKCACFH